MTAAPRLPDFEQRLEVETPEQVAFTYTIAGVGSRAAAAIIDYLCCFGLLVAVVILGQLAAKAVGRSLFESEAGPWLFALVVAAQFFLLWGWYVLWEGLADGQTPGKRRLGLRVVADGGYPVSFSASAIRNLVRAIDLQPAFSYGVGITSVAVSKSGKRLGDIAAGTIVVHERTVTLVAPGATAARGGTAASGAPPAALVTLLTDDEFQLLERFVARRGDLAPDRRARLVEGLAARFRPRVPGLGGSDAAVLLTLHERERAARASGVAARSDTGARREQHALVARGSERWTRFAALLASVRARGLRNLSESEVSAFVGEYREIAADLARLRTASRGRDVDAVYFVSRLVAGAHNLFYRRADIPTRSLLRFLGADVPAEIRRSWRPILLSAFLLFAPLAGFWYAVVADPALAPQLVPAGMIDRAQTAGSRERQGELYLPQNMAKAQGPVLASLITTNNIQVTFNAFAGGITAGVLTVLALVVNGASFGSALGVFQHYGALHLIVGFVAAHGVLELTAICIAAGAGFLLAKGILLPGPVTRGEAIVANARRAIRLIAASTVMLVAAGLIEGNISPSPTWTPNEKYLVALATGLAFALWVLQARGHEPGAPAPAAPRAPTVPRAPSLRGSD